MRQRAAIAVFDFTNNSISVAEHDADFVNGEYRISFEGEWLPFSDLDEGETATEILRPGEALGDVADCLAERLKLRMMGYGIL